MTIFFWTAATAALKFHGYFTLGAMFVKTDLIPGTAAYHNACAEGNVKYHMRPASGISCRRHPAPRGLETFRGNYIQSIILSSVCRRAPPGHIACGFRSIGGINVIR